MASCAQCGSTILFGGVRDGGVRLCNDHCFRERQILIAAEAHISPDTLRWEVQRVHQGSCSRCLGPGPVDVHRAYSVWSMFVVSVWREHTNVCCQACARGLIFSKLAFTAILGWWSIHGLFCTPAFLVRNILSIVRPPDPRQPSVHLEAVIRAYLVERILGRGSG